MEIDFGVIVVNIGNIKEVYFFQIISICYIKDVTMQCAT